MIPQKLNFPFGQSLARCPPNNNKTPIFPLKNPKSPIKKTKKKSVLWYSMYYAPILVKQCSTQPVVHCESMTSVPLEWLVSLSLCAVAVLPVIIMFWFCFIEICVLWLTDVHHFKFVAEMFLWHFFFLENIIIICS